MQLERWPITVFLAHHISLEGIWLVNESSNPFEKQNHISMENIPTTYLTKYSLDFQKVPRHKIHAKIVCQIHHYIRIASITY